MPPKGVVMAEDVTLADYLSTAPGKGGDHCFTCSVPPELLEQVTAVVRECRTKAVSPKWRAMTRWLTEQGVTAITVTKLTYHFERKHDERG